MVHVLKRDLENFQMVNEVKYLLNSNHHGCEECLNYCMHVIKSLRCILHNVTGRDF